MKAIVEWDGEMGFVAHPPSGFVFTMDSDAEFGGKGKGPMPMETLLCALAACTGMDVISILKKKRQTVTSYRIEVQGERPPQGQWPRPFTLIVVKHYVEGPNLDEEAVKRAVELSDEKYCSVSASLRSSVEIRSEWVVNSLQT
jgi:putative redox protein